MTLFSKAMREKIEIVGRIETSSVPKHGEVLPRVKRDQSNISLRWRGRYPWNLTSAQAVLMSLRAFISIGFRSNRLPTHKKIALRGQAVLTSDIVKLDHTRRHWGNGTVPHREGQLKQLRFRPNSSNRMHETQIDSRSRSMTISARWQTS